ncbi:AMP-binding protein [Gordonia sp. CPCC 206044]|uniref:AMP-binding protein n=1 Tax=Gordonia sp. CPCC 206044 TaxID=3140793 RepID=UPI003AF35BBA
MGDEAPEPQTEAPGFAAELDRHLRSYRDGAFIEYARRWYSGDEVTGLADALLAEMDRCGIPGHATVGLVARNRVPHAAAALGLIADGRPVTMIYSYQSPGSIGRDIETLAPAVVVADSEDWTEPTVAAARRTGCLGISLTLHPRLAAEVIAPPSAEMLARASATRDAAGLHILSSGTTCPPKRTHLRIEVLRHTVTTMTMGATGCHRDPPELVYWPFGSVGICQLLAAPFLDKRMVLLEKFSVEDWVRAVKTYRIRRAGVQPALLRMILDSGVPREDLASLEYLPGGSGPLEPELREEFERTYGIPLLWAYGATEFAGSVCAWTPEDHRLFGADKPRSVGRSLPGVHVRIVDRHDPDQRRRSHHRAAGHVRQPSAGEVCR